MRGTLYARLSILPLLLAASASAGVTLPIGNFACGLYEGTGNFGGNPLVTNCTSNAAVTQEASPPAPGITGVSFGTTSSVTWNPAGDHNGGTQAYPPGFSPESVVDTLVMQTSGPIAGDQPGAQFIGSMPVHYSFSITTGTISCLTTTPCNFSQVSLSWTLLFLVQGPGVSNPDGERASAFGSGTGSFSGDLSVPATFGCCTLSPNIMTITQDPNVNTVYVGLSLIATLPEDVSATYSISIPQTGSFDFESESSIPEPGTMGLLALAILFLGGLRCRDSQRL